MPSREPISSDEWIIRRIPPRPNCTVDRPGIGLTATSFAIRPRPQEKYPSWSRRALTSPRRLLQLAASSGIDTTGWQVAQLKVADVRQLGLDVVPEPTEEDPGHCHIVDTATRPFSDAVWSKLAPKALIVDANAD